MYLDDYLIDLRYMYFHLEDKYNTVELNYISVVYLRRKSIEMKLLNNSIASKICFVLSIINDGKHINFD